MMFNTLRSRFVLSHTLPLLLIVPLTGIALIYALETQVLLVNLGTETREEAALLAQLVSDRTDLWSDPAKAQAYVNQVKPQLTADMMFLDTQGHLLASSNAADAAHIGQSLQLDGLTSVLAGETRVHTDYSQSSDVEIVDALVPVMGPDRQMLGVVRLTHHLASVYEQFLRLREVIAGILGVALVLGAGVGLVLALNLELPLRQVTEAVYRLSNQQELAPLPEQGPENIRTLLHAFNTLTERLRQLEETRRNLLYNLVHELGTPLGALHSGIQALQGGANEQAALREELLSGMAEEVTKLRRLLDDLARLYDKVLGTTRLDLQPLQLPEWLLRVLAPWRRAALAKGLRWDIQIASNLPTLQADPDRLLQVLGNLLSNAIKYTGSGGEISVAAGLEDKQVWIRVSDTGVGIPRDEQVLIFDPFYRSRLGGRFSQGMGLGLSIARDLAVAHGGRLEVKSVPGQGSRFTLWLPLVTP
jgi:signal transduction histidine kinase